MLYRFISGIPRSLQSKVSDVMEGISENKSVTVDESLEIAKDGDPTVPMDLSSGMSATVEGMVRRDIEQEVEMKDGMEEKGDDEVRFLKPYSSFW